MSEATLMNLRDYLYGTLSRDDMVWLACELTERARQEEPQKPYTKEELMARVEGARQRIAEGHYTTSEELWRELDEEFYFLDKEEVEEMELAEAV